MSSPLCPPILTRRSLPDARDPFNPYGRTADPCDRHQGHRRLRAGDRGRVGDGTTDQQTNRSDGHPKASVEVFQRASGYVPIVPAPTERWACKHRRAVWSWLLFDSPPPLRRFAVAIRGADRLPLFCLFCAAGVASRSMKLPVRPRRRLDQVGYWRDSVRRFPSRPLMRQIRIRGRKIPLFMAFFAGHL